jgi:hypothetical protein
MDEVVEVDVELDRHFSQANRTHRPELIEQKQGPQTSNALPPVIYLHPCGR